MTLPTSGTISLTDIQNEFGGTSPTSLSEYYAGGAYVASGTSGTNGAVPSSGTISLSNFYGTAAFLDTQTVTVGFQTFTIDDRYSDQYGFALSAYGSISDGMINFLSGAAVQNIAYINGFDGTDFYSNVTFAVTGGFPNSGWSSMRINGTTFLRSAASYSSGAATTWLWSGAANPFPGIGASTAVQFLP